MRTRNRLTERSELINKPRNRTSGALLGNPKHKLPNISMSLGIEGKSENISIDTKQEN